MSGSCRRWTVTRAKREAGDVDLFDRAARRLQEIDGRVSHQLESCRLQLFEKRA